MKTFIRFVELWIPDSKREHLEHGGGLYAGAPVLAAVSRHLIFGRGEGLPGQAWDLGRPVVLNRLEGSYFRRSRVARELGLSSATAIPVFAGEFLIAVVVFFCADDDAHAGAIELWHAQPDVSPDMRLLEAYYGRTAEAFEFLSRNTAFRKGHGLPGLAWESGRPVFIDDLGKSARFLRRETAQKVGINRGLAIPCHAEGDEVCVLAFLSALGTPIARRFEIWVPDDAHRFLLRQEGFCEHEGRLPASPAAKIERGAGPIGKVLNLGVPVLSDRAVLELGAYAPFIERAGLTSLAALPLIDRGALTAVVVWYF